MAPWYSPERQSPGNEMPFVTCPECGKESVAPREFVGLEWDCPRCGAPFRVTEDGAPFGAVRRKRQVPLPLLVALVSLCQLVGGIAFVMARRPAREHEAEARGSADLGGTTRPSGAKRGAPPA